MDNLQKLISNKRLIKYFVMAIIIVLLELLTFQLVYLSSSNYYVATIISFVVGVLLNWIGGRVFVFGTSGHNKSREFAMVFLGSLVGVCIQLSVVYISVAVLLLYPLIGKVLSICFSFIWNYWFRAKIVYKTGQDTNNTPAI
jgi:putative flippase GtrA